MKRSEGSVAWSGIEEQSTCGGPPLCRRDDRRAGPEDLEAVLFDKARGEVAEASRSNRNEQVRAENLVAAKYWGDVQYRTIATFVFFATCWTTVVVLGANGTISIPPWPVRKVAQRVGRTPVVPQYDEGVTQPKRKVSLSLDEDLVALFEGGGEALSTQVNQALRLEVERRRRQRALTALLQRLDELHGPLNSAEDELEIARLMRLLGGPA